MESQTEKKSRTRVRMEWKVGFLNDLLCFRGGKEPPTYYEE